MTDLLLQLLRGLLQMLSDTIAPPDRGDAAGGVGAGVAPSLPAGAWTPTCGGGAWSRRRVWVHVAIFAVSAALMAWFVHLGLGVAVAVLALANTGLIAFLIAERILGPGGPPRRRAA